MFIRGALFCNVRRFLFVCLSRVCGAAIVYNKYMRFVVTNNIVYVSAHHCVPPLPPQVILGVLMVLFFCVCEDVYGVFS